MSQENVEIARAFFQAWDAKDIDAALACAAPRSRWIGRGPKDSRHAATADMRESEAFGTTFFETFDRLTVSPA